MNAATPIAIRRRVTLTPSQRTLLASRLQSPTEPAQNMALLARFDATVEPVALAAAIDAVIGRSDALRTVIDSADASQARVVDAAPVSTALVELTDLEVGAWAAERARHRLELDQACYDSVVLQDATGVVYWFCNFHHVVVDAASYVVFFDAVAAEYHGHAYDLAAYYEVTDQLLADTPVRRRARAHWADRKPVERLDRLYSPAGRSAASHRVIVRPGADLAGRVEERLGNEYATLSNDLAATALLVAAAALHAATLAGVDEVTIGIPVHNRRSAAARRTIGPLMELFPVDVCIRSTDTARQVQAQALLGLMTTLRHAVPGTVVDSDFNVVVNVIAGEVPVAFGDVPVSVDWIATGAMDASHLERVQLTSYGDGDSGPSGFGPGTALHLDLDAAACPEHVRPEVSEHFAAALRFLVDDLDAPVSSMVLCTENDAARLDQWEVGPIEPAPAMLVGRALRDRLAADPSVVARDGSDAVTGTQLWNWIEAFAVHLAGERRVMVELAPSVQAIVAIAAAVVAGVPFVPVDPSHPEARRDRLATRAEASRRIRSRVDVDPFRSVDRNDETGNRAELVDVPTPSDEAYLIFTSGSTGEPKGVPITQQALADYVRFAVDSYFVSRADQPAARSGTDTVPAVVAALFGSLSFDLTITSIFAPLLAGGSVVTVAEAGPAALSRIAEHRDITWIKATPSHLEVLVRLLPDDHQLSTYVVGGEAFGSRLAATLLRQRPDAVIFNEYGPTEAVVGCMIHRVDADDLHRAVEVPIGRPAPNVTLRVADETGNRLPPGATGELWISHPGLTAGYLRGDLDDDDDDDADADDRFDPFVLVGGLRWYRSGDLVQLDADDRLVYRGRLDEQLKIGAVRLDPLEVEAALDRHPAVARSVVRMWAPKSAAPGRHCMRCGLPDNVPGVAFDDAGVCDTCVTFDLIEAGTRSWFKTPDALLEVRDRGRARSRGEYDCLALLSGGKDSTYALYRLVELGFRPYALTLDNGFISEGAKDNVRACTAALGVDHEFVTSEHMNEIFRDSLSTFSNVCNGCYKTIYTLAVNRAVELDIPIIVTGLSRGQLFETRLVPEQFQLDRFDPAAIDRAVLAARKHYHRVSDVPNRLLDTEVFADDDLFERIEFVDIYRYLDVELEQMLHDLAQRTPWQRPADTGRSTNCLINVAGIHTHLLEQGYHNYAVPYAWDVRLGHKTRDEAIAELQDHLDTDEVGEMLETVGYTPRPRETLTAWVELQPGADLPSPTGLRGFLAETLPRHALPAAFVVVDDVPMTANGKLDEQALPAPERTHRSGVTAIMLPGTESERLVIDAWEAALGIEPIGPEDDFFSIGGDSLLALEMIVQLGGRLGLRLGEELAFLHTTPRDLATAIEEAQEASAGEPDDGAPSSVDEGPRAFAASMSIDSAGFTPGEQSVLFEQRRAPDRHMYNLGRVYRIHGSVEVDGLEAAVRSAVATHRSMSHGYGPGRRQLGLDHQVDFSCATDVVSVDALEAVLEPAHRAPFDLVRGPLVRCRVQSIDDGTVAVLLAAHHVTCDLDSLAVLWQQIERCAHGGHIDRPAVDSVEFDSWLQHRCPEDARAFWLDRVRGFAPTSFLGRPTGDDRHHGDGFIRIVAGVRAAELAAVAGRTAPALAVAAAAAALGPYFEGAQVPLALVASTRMHPDADELVGYLLNPLLLQIRASADRDLGAVTSDAAAQITPALSHRGRPIAQIVADARSAGLPLSPFDVLVSVDSESTASYGDLSVTQHAMFNGDAVADLSFFVEIRRDVVDVSLEYRASTVGPALARDLVTRFAHALTAATQEPATRIAALTGVAPASVAVGPALASTRPVLDQLLEHVARQPDHAAVRCGDIELTWDELGRRSALVAAALSAAGVEPGSRVLLAVPRSVELVASIVGIVRAGCSYVPIDPGYPAARIARIIDAADADIALVGQVVDLPGRVAALRIGPDGIDGSPWILGAGAATSSVDRAEIAIDPDDVAYVIFTSGSTGVPHGVAVTHAQLAASTNGRRQFYAEPVGEFVVLSTAAFDSSIVGLFWTLVDGGTIVLPTESEAHDVDALVSLLTPPTTTHVLCVPTLYRALLQRRPATATHWPLQVIVAGEACPSSLIAEHFAAVPGAALTNEYGPTEATVWATAHHVAPTDTSAPIGRPIPGAWVAVVDDDRRPVPEGVVGELLIGGAGVNAGYVGGAATSAERFGTVTESENADGEAPALTAAPLADLPAGRYFLTGDRCEMRDGVVWFLGRVDDQLNVGGVRVEPGEIEAVLLRHADVSAAVVAAVDPRPLEQLIEDADADALRDAFRHAAAEDEPSTALAELLRASSDGRSELTAHIETTDPTIVPALRRLVADSLPTTMAPATYRLHAELPRTPNGKTDRAATLALPLVVAAPSVTARQDDRPAGADLTGALLGAFRAVLDAPDFEPIDSFFDRGGDSLKSLVLLHRLEELLDISMSTSEIFEHPTPERLATHLAADGVRIAAFVARRGPGFPATARGATGCGTPRTRRRELRSLVVPISTTGDRAPFFAVHHLGTDGELFRPLSALLGASQPVYGLAAPLPLEPFGAAEYDIGIEYDVASIAGSYVAEIDRLAPDGPVIIGGTCQGALFAYEVAQQLKSRGRDVPLLVMLTDWHAPHIVYSDRGGILIRKRFLDLRRQGWPGVKRLLSVRGPRLRLQRKAEIIALRLVRRLGRDAPKRLQVREYIETSLQHFNAYAYEPYRGAAIVVRGADDRRISEADQTAGWGDLIDQLDIEFVPGWGVTILREPNVDATADVVRAALDAV